MTTDELLTALEHDLAQKESEPATPKSLVLARYCIQNAAVGARGAECALVACDPPAVVEARQAVQLAMQSLEQALIFLSTLESENV